MELKQPLSERVVRKMAKSPRRFHPWVPFVFWLPLTIYLPVAIYMLMTSRDKMGTGLFCNGFVVSMCILMGIYFFERDGWLHLLDSKDSELRQMQMSRDDLQRQLDAIANDQSINGPDTRIRG
jgi:hypothetical protein